MSTTTTPPGRPWRLAALAATAVLAIGSVATAGQASAGGPALAAGDTAALAAGDTAALAADSSPAPVLTCRTPLGSPLPTQSAAPAPGAVVARPAPMAAVAPDAPGTAPLPVPPLADVAATGPDTTPPSAPGELTATLTGATRATLAWSASTDDIAVTGYEVWGGVYYEVPGWATICATTLITTVVGATSVDLDLAPPANPNVTAVRYTFFVKALDAAGNTSAPSNSVRVTVPSASPSPPGDCLVAYTTQGEWPGGFQAALRITNSASTPVNGWRLTFTFAGDEQIRSAWNATVTQSGRTVTATNADWNGVIPPGGTVTFGIQGVRGHSVPLPTDFTVNGVRCTAG